MLALSGSLKVKNQYIQYDIILHCSGKLKSTELALEMKYHRRQII